MDFRAWRGTANTVVISATTASTVNQLATTLSAAEGLRVVNESAATALVSISSSTSPDATADARTMRVVAASERVFDWSPTYNSVSIALSSGTGTVSIQLGKGV